MILPITPIELVRDRIRYQAARLLHVDAPDTVALSVIRHQLEVVAESTSECQTALVWLDPKRMIEWMGGRKPTGWKLVTYLSLHYLDPEAGAVRYGSHDAVLVYQRKKTRGLPECLQTWMQIPDGQTAALSAIPGKSRPIPWIQKWLNHWTEPGDLVLDLYPREGDMAKACLWSSRAYVGAMVNPEDMARVQHELMEIHKLLGR